MARRRNLMAKFVEALSPSINEHNITMNDGASRHAPSANPLFFDIEEDHFEDSRQGDFAMSEIRVDSNANEDMKATLETENEVAIGMEDSGEQTVVISGVKMIVTLDDLAPDPGKSNRWMVVTSDDLAPDPDIGDIGVQRGQILWKFAQIAVIFWSNWALFGLPRAGIG